MAKLLGNDAQRIHELPRDFSAVKIASRQIESVRAGKIVVESGLASTQRRIKSPVAFLSFETINPTIPFWPGCAPFSPVLVQFSFHVHTAKGVRERHRPANRSEDPAPVLAIWLSRTAAPPQQYLRCCRSTNPCSLPKRKPCTRACSRIAGGVSMPWSGFTSD
ncbi:MAG: DUF2779 domain-containing protein [Steroidobacteraceae bacterium]|nr:DUF2779 domain-containing protein [Steroidobacteraceae bacterium]